jgi:hypothetical protein
VATRRRYTAKQKAEAVGIAVVEGVTEAERQTGIPKTTIDYWQNMPEFVQLRTTARETVADQFWAGIQIGLREVVKGLQADDVPLRDKHAALGTIYDRHALLTGGATGRTESRDLNDLPDSAYVAAIQEARRLSSGEGADPAPAEEPAG